MEFSSAAFLFIFLPAVWLLCTLIPRRFIGAKNVLLAAASLVFYAFGEPVYVLVMLASAAVNYVFGLIMGRYVRSRKAVGVIAIVLNLALLVFFKYIPWLTELMNGTFGLSVPVPSIDFPAGISFYTFQTLTYIIDVKRGRAEAQKSFVKLFLFISFFPQLLMGPIIRYTDIEEQLSSRTVTAEKTAHGVRRFIVGLSKKVLISNTVAAVADAAFADGAHSSALLWLGAAAYCFQLYFDFSGYSDMAIGMAEMFGFGIKENFDYPYIALSICDFWKRWHISLTSWFREYVYFPLGGSRCSKPRAMFNRFLIFFLSGIWHGANLTYVLWGVWHGFLMVIEQLTGWGKLAEKRAVKPFAWVYSMLAVLLGFVMFRADSVTAAFSYIGGMFSFGGGTADASAFLSPWMIVIFAAAVLFSTPVVPFVGKKLSETEKGARAASVIGYAAVVPLLVLCVGMIASASFSPSIYFGF